MYYALYKDQANLWRWRLVTADGKTIADSGVSYWSKADAERGIDLNKASYNAPVYA